MNRHPARRGRTGIGRPWHTRSTTQKLWTVLRALCLVVAAALALGLPAQAASRGRTAQASQSTTVALADIASTKHAVYALATDHTAVYEWSAGKKNWTKVGGPTKNLYAGHDDLYATNPGTGDIYHYNGKPNSWTRIGGPGATFTTTDKHLYGLSPSGNAVYEYTGKGDAWTKVRGATGQIYSNSALYATDPVTGDISKYNGKPNSWTRIGGPGATFTTTHEADKVIRVFKDEAAADLYGLAPDHSAVWKYTGKGDTWTSLGAPVTPANQSEKLQLLDSMTQMGNTAANAWYKALGEHRQGKPDRYEFDWSTNNCNAPAPDAPAGFDFTLACVRHDFGYRNYKEVLGDESFKNSWTGRSSKDRVDRIFLQDMKDVCMARDFPYDHTPVQRQLCLQIANTYYVAVVGAPAVGLG